MAGKTAKRYECGVCGKERTADEMIYSAWTGARFCGVELAACDRRAAARRRARKREKVAA